MFYNDECVRSGAAILQQPLLDYEKFGPPPKNTGVEEDRLSTNTQSPIGPITPNDTMRGFKVQPLDLLRTSGKCVTQVARKFRISVSTLHTWKRRLLHGPPSPASSVPYGT